MSSCSSSEKTVPEVPYLKLVIRDKVPLSSGPRAWPGGSSSQSQKFAVFSHSLGSISPVPRAFREAWPNALALWRLVTGRRSSALDRSRSIAGSDAGCSPLASPSPPALRAPALRMTPATHKASQRGSYTSQRDSPAIAGSLDLRRTPHTGQRPERVGFVDGLCNRRGG
jgi:hypothetical protein